MSNQRPPVQPRPPSGQKPPRLPESAMPRSPAEALEPTRGPARPRGRRQRREARRLSPALRMFNGILTLTAIVLALGGGALMWFEREISSAGPAQAPRSVVIREREGSRDIAQRLETEGVIASHHVFIAYYVARSMSAWFGGKPLQLKAGEYLIEPGQSVREIAEEIGKGRSVLVGITIPEGLTTHQIVERLKADQGLTGEIAAVPPEGSLLPDTYKVPRGMTRAAVIDLMQAESRKFVEKAWAQRRPDLPVKTPAEAVILASIIEKETGKRDERERVAAVFVNRLRIGMKLQSDPTILYGLYGGQTQWGKPITRSEINSRTAHNTYQIAALPPTPICNPGRAAILATLAPAATKELYFVADGNGGHIFSETLKEHNAAVGLWRKAEKEMRARQVEAQHAKAAQRAAAPVQAMPVQATPVQAMEPDLIEAADTQQQTPPPAKAAAGVPPPVRKPAPAKKQ